MWTKTSSSIPKSPDFGYRDDSVVASSNGVEDADAIDPAFLYAEGHLWLSYGTYFGFIRVLELDPKTAKRIPGSKPTRCCVIDMEATDMMYRDGWYYLLGTHGTCCDGPNSTYNIRVGRSRKPLGPYVDNEGIPLLKGGGKLVVAASGRHIGPGHFGLLDLGDGIQKFSCHYEADMDRSGRSILDIRPLLWMDGWPLGGDNFQGRNLRSSVRERSGFGLQLAVDFVRMDNGRRGPPGGGPPPAGAAAGGTGAPRPAGAPAGGPGGGFQPGACRPQQSRFLIRNSPKVQEAWPTGTIGVDLSDYMVRPNQEWKITPVTDVGGYPGSPYFKIQIAGTERTLAATTEKRCCSRIFRLPALPSSYGCIDQMTDGTYRIMPKSMSGLKEPLVLTAVGASSPTFGEIRSQK